jgi:GntR family transcriptional regulator
MPKAQRTDPPYVQVMNYFRERILDGTLSEGDRLPPVTEIAPEWGIAHATAARAISQLQIEGFVRTSPRGTFVEPLRAGSTTPRDRMTRVRRTGTTASTAEHEIVRVAELIRAPVYVADLLDIDPAGQVVRRETVTVAGRRPRAEPVALTVQWYPPHLAGLIPDLLETRPMPGLIGRIEEATGSTLVHGEDHFHGRASDAREASALALPTGTPILAAAYLWRCQDGNVLEYGEFCLPPRRTLRYDYEITPENETGAGGSV